MPKMTKAEFTAALARWKWTAQANDKQIKRELEDLAFQLPENAWTAEARKERTGQIIDGVAIPPRPMLSIATLDQPIATVLNMEKAAHLGVTVHPVTEDADDKTAEVQRDLYRTIERDSNAATARSWAFDRAVKAGRGAYRVLTEYDDQSGHPLDQKIVIKRILRQEMVFFDQAAESSDFCDGDDVWLAAWMPMDRFKAAYKQSKIAKFDGNEFAEYVAEQPEWASASDTGRDAVLVCERYWKVRSQQTLIVLDDGSWVTEGEDAPGGRVEVARRVKEIVSVRWSKMTGKEELEYEDWNGQYLPIIPVIGRELQPYNAERVWIGMVRPARDAVRMFNASASNALEFSSMEPKAPWMIAEGQDEGYEHEYQQANIRNLAALHYKPTSVEGHPVPPPGRVQVDASRLGPSMLLLEKAQSFITAATSSVDTSRMEQLSRRRVAKDTIARLDENADHARSDYLNNLAEISMRYEAKVILDLMGKVYDRPGRVVQLLGVNDEIKPTALNAPFVRDAETQRPILLDAMGMPQQPGRQRPAGATVEQFDLSKGGYAASVSIGKSYQTRLEHGSSEIGEMMQALGPEIGLVVAPTYLKFRDFPGATEVSEDVKKLRDAKFPFLREGEDQAGKAEALQQENGVMKQQLQQATEYIQQEQAKYESQERIKAQESETKIALQRMQDATAIEVAKIHAMTKGLELDAVAQNEAVALAQEQAFASQQAEAQRQHEAAVKAHEAAMQAVDQDHQARMAAQDAARAAAVAEREAEREAQRASAPPARETPQAPPQIVIGEGAIRLETPTGKRRRKRIERDAKGQIVGVTEEDE
jgi:hypothetical protein